MAVGHAEHYRVKTARQPKAVWHAPFVCSAIAASVLAAGCGRSSDRPNPRFASADSLIVSAMEAHKFPGAVLLIGQAGDIIHQRAFGHARLYEYGGAAVDRPEPMTVGHAFDLASLTKVLGTTIATMILVDRGDMSLDEPLGAYVQCLSGGSKDSITVRQVLAHTSGLHQWKPIYYHAANATDAIRYICELDTAFPPGQRRYSDLGFMLLGAAIANVSGKPLDAFVRDEIFLPLGLRRTGYNPPTTAGPFVATSRGNPFEKRMVEDENFGYRVEEDPANFGAWRRYVLVGEVNDGNAYHAFDGVAGHAGLFSTAEEIHVLLRLVQVGGTLRGTRFFGESVRDEFLKPDANGAGLGWAMSADTVPLTDPPAGAFGHTGFTGTYAAVLPQYDLAIVLLTNRQHGGVLPSGGYPSLITLQRDIVEYVIGAL